MGDVAVWELSSRARIASRSFKVWNLVACSMALQVALETIYRMKNFQLPLYFVSIE